jgi:hypothetical protein
MSHCSRLLVLVLLFAPLPAYAQVLYVDADAMGANTGASWADAFTDLQSALTAADPGTEIWVAEGTYRPTDGIDRFATFQLASGVGLFGGFDGTEATREARDWAAHETVLSGDIGTPGTATDNSYHVVTGSGTDASAVLDGFTITAAYADGTAAPDGTNARNRGGGMRNVAGSPTVRHCVFRANEARNSNVAAIGAGMFNIDGSSPLLDDIRFEGNVSERQAGGLGNRNSSHPTLRDVVFVENEAGDLGGGMTNESGSAPVLIDVQFVRNHAGGWTGGLDNYRASPSLYNVAFYGNTCGNYGCGMTNDTNADALVVNAVFVGNRKLDGGEVGAAGLQNNGSSPTLVGVTFVGNTAPEGSADGLGHRGAGAVTLRDVILWGNGDELVDEAGGALDVSHAVVDGGFPDGTAVLDSDPRFVRMPSPGPDGTWGTGDDDYGDLRLRVDSPALNTGDAAHLPSDLADLDGDDDTGEPVPVDLAGEARVTGAALDLGAYEGGVTVSAEPGGDASGAGLGAVYPNPTRGAVTIPFTLGHSGPVTLRVVDVLGREVVRLVDAPLARGVHTVAWDMRALAAGLYFVVLRTGDARAVRPVTVG